MGETAATLETGAVNGATPQIISVQPQVSQTVIANNLKEHIFLCLYTTRIGRRKRINAKEMEAITTEADKTLLRVTKTLLDCEEFDAVANFDSAVKTYLREHATPYPFSPGFYCIAMELYPKVDKYLKEREPERKALVDALLAKWDEIKGHDKERLGPLYSDADYPPREIAEQAFAFGWQVMTFGVPDNLAGLSRKIMQEEQAKFEKQAQKAVETAQQVIFQMADETVDYLRNRLAPDDDGKPKVIRKDMLPRLRAFWDDLGKRAFGDDERMNRIIEKGREILNDGELTTLKLRTSESVRQNVAAQLTELKEEISGMIVDRPTRRIELED